MHSQSSLSFTRSQTDERKMTMNSGRVSGRLIVCNEN